MEEATEWVVRLNDVAATEQDFAAWQIWLAADPSHARAFNEVQDTWRRSASVRRIADAQAPELRRMRDELDFAIEGSRRRRARTRWAALAASLGAVGVGFWIWRPAAEVVETQTAELRSVRLPDGSRAALGPETRLEIAYTEGERTLRMSSGEAYFDVAHMPQRPFTVDTPAGRVVAIGTAFSVHATERRVSVAVTEGRVRVEPFGNLKRGPPLVVSTGQRFVRDGAKTGIEPLASTADVVAWQHGRLEYQGEPFRVVVADINRYSPKKLRIADPVLGELKYTGTVFPDSLDAWLASIEGVFPVQVAEAKGEHLILRAD